MESTLSTHWRYRWDWRVVRNLDRGKDTEFVTVAPIDWLEDLGGAGSGTSGDIGNCRGTDGQEVTQFVAEVVAGKTESAKREILI